MTPTARPNDQALAGYQAPRLAPPRSSMGQLSRRPSQASNCAGVRTLWSSTAV
jgi:hypothetical protein